MRAPCNESKPISERSRNVESPVVLFTLEDTPPREDMLGKSRERGRKQEKDDEKRDRDGITERLTVNHKNRLNRHEIRCRAAKTAASLMRAIGAAEE
jgi:hypothetical protein